MTLSGLIFYKNLTWFLSMLRLKCERHGQSARDLSEELHILGGGSWRRGSEKAKFSHS